MVFVTTEVYILLLCILIIIVYAKAMKRAGDQVILLHAFEIPPLPYSSGPCEYWNDFFFVIPGATLDKTNVRRGGKGGGGGDQKSGTKLHTKKLLLNFSHLWYPQILLC